MNAGRLNWCQRGTRAARAAVPDQGRDPARPSVPGRSPPAVSRPGTSSKSLRKAGDRQGRCPQLEEIVVKADGTDAQDVLPFVDDPKLRRKLGGRVRGRALADGRHTGRRRRVSRRAGNDDIAMSGFSATTSSNSQ